MRIDRRPVAFHAHPALRRLWTLTHLLLLGLVVACSPQPPANPLVSQGVDTIRPLPASFFETFQEAGPLLLHQSPDTPVVRVSGTDFSSGELLLGDVSEGNVKRFDASTGALVQVIGQRGEGPGEFSQPRFPRYGPDGNLHIGDGQQGRITVVAEDGSVIRTVILRDFAIMMGMAVLENGSYVVLSSRIGSDHMLHVLDSLGNVTSSHLAIKGIGPSNGATSRFFRNLANSFLSVHSGVAYVTHALSDTLWTVELDSGLERRSVISLPGYVAPTEPQSPLRGASDLMAWSKEFHLTMFPAVGDSLVAIPFVRGVLNYGDPQLLVVRLADGSWRAFEDAPPLVNVHAGRLWALLDPLADESHLVSFRQR